MTIKLCLCTVLGAMLLSGAPGPLHARDPGRELLLLWYNAENLFHPSDDSLQGDDEFTPGGIRGWSMTRYRNKLTRIARVIVAAGGWEPPALVGLGEVENATVLEDLVSHPILKPYHYSYFHREGPDHRGMEVACLFREPCFQPEGWETVMPVESEAFGRTREILHLWGRWGRKDTLDLFLVHLISRYRGAGATAGYRRLQCEQLARLADSVAGERPGSLLVLSGDFNEARGGFSMEPLLDRNEGGKGPQFVEFTSGGHSYKYRGVWSGIDHFLVTGERDAYRITASVFNHPSLLVPDEAYGGVKPFRT
jgi:hypothetical protein